MEKKGGKVNWIVKGYGKYEENCEKIGKIQKKSKLNSEMMWKIWKKSKLKCEILWKIWKKIVQRYGKYGRK
jgi:hypothetical protein